MHTCQALRGLAHCECHAGYRLAADRKACEGKTASLCPGPPTGSAEEGPMSHWACLAVSTALGLVGTGLAWGGPCSSGLLGAWGQEEGPGGGAASRQSLVSAAAASGRL